MKNDNFKYFEDLEISEEILEFSEAENLQEAKQQLKRGKGVKINNDKGIYYSEEQLKIYLLKCSEDEDVNEVLLEDLQGMEIDIEEADEILTEFFELKSKREEELNKRKKELDNWLSETN